MVTKLHSRMVEAQTKANDTTIKLEIVRFFKENYNCKFFIILTSGS